MSRIRSVHPGFFTDEDLVSVSSMARLLFIGLGTEADDKGVFVWKPLTLKMRLFPADNLRIDELLSELIAVNALKQYEIDGKKYGAIRNFMKFQSPRRPNDLYPITAEIGHFVGLTADIPANFADNEPLAEDYADNGGNGAALSDPVPARRGEERRGEENTQTSFHSVCVDQPRKNENPENSEIPKTETGNPPLEEKAEKCRRKFQAAEANTSRSIRAIEAKTNRGGQIAAAAGIGEAWRGLRENMSGADVARESAPSPDESSQTGRNSGRRESPPVGSNPPASEQLLATTAANAALKRKADSAQNRPSELAAGQSRSAPQQRAQSSANGGKGGNGTRLPDDWRASETEINFARQEGFSEAEIAHIAAQFADYWHGIAGAKGRKADWPATWRMWVRRQDRPLKAAGGKSGGIGSAALASYPLMLGQLAYSVWLGNKTEFDAKSSLRQFYPQEPPDKIAADLQAAISAERQKRKKLMQSRTAMH